MAKNDLLAMAKLALRKTKADVLDQQIAMLIDAGMQDLGLAGVVIPEESASIVNKAVITYVMMSYGAPDNYKLLKESYDEQKAQLMVATGFTNWSPSEV